jgi:hypothetical protein
MGSNLFAGTQSDDLTAVNDVASVVFNSPTEIDALANDVFKNCTKEQITVDTVAGSGLRRGTIAINSDRTFTYTPQKTAFGIDSVQYSIKCGTETHRATIYILISKPQSLHNVACKNAKIVVGMTSIPNVKYFWYNVPTGGSIVATSPADVTTITKNSDNEEIRYVEPRYGNMIFPRVPISVLKSDNCETEQPSSCATNGQLLFREDFGGNSTSAPRIPKLGLPSGTTEYIFKTTDQLKANQYTLLKYIDFYSTYAWQKNLSDHTYTDRNIGYMFLVDASNDAGKFYETQIAGLCDNIHQLEFSAWVANIIPKSNTTAIHDPILKFELADDNNNIICQYVTSVVPRDKDGAAKWRNYGFTFDPKKYKSLKLRIYNNAAGSNGNDFALDDIEIRLCVPPINMTKAADTACLGSSYTLAASYTDDGTFTSAGQLAYRWQYSAVNDPQATWTTVNEGTGDSTTLDAKFTIADVDVKHQGYYRLLVANSATIDFVNCRMVSKSFYLHVKTIDANNDMAMAIYNHPINIDVLGNDSLVCCTDTSKLKIVTVAGSGPRNGSLKINPDKTFTYTPKQDFSGIDSVDYTVEYHAIVKRARLLIFISKPLSLHNVACPGATMTIGMYPITNIQYYWYSVPTGGTATSASPTNQVSITVKKEDPNVQTWYVEARYKDKVSPRYAISILKSDNCGSENPAGCAIDGQLLFREDFGGNETFASRVSTTALSAGATAYTFKNAENLDKNQYTLVKYIDSKSPVMQSYVWQKDFSDHTHAGNLKRGYMFLVNAANEPGKFYETQITGLCDNIDRLYFSAWVANVIPTTNKAPDDPRLKFELVDENNNIIGTYITSVVPRDPQGKVKWRNYGFAFDPKGYTSLKLRIYNNAPGNNGNDFALDDIEIRLCVPPITIESKMSDTLCINDSTRFTASYEDVSGTFTNSGKELAYRWEYSIDGRNWSIVGSDSLTAAKKIKSICVINKAVETDHGFYHFVVSNLATIDHPACRVVSKPIALNVHRAYQASDFRALIVPSSVSHTVYLSNFIDTADIVSLKWSSVGGDFKFINDTTGAIDARTLMPHRVYTIRYTVTSRCGVSSAKAYIFTSPEKFYINNNKEIFVCKDLRLSKYVNLHQILGLESNGTWSYPSDNLGIIADNVKTSSAKYGSSKIFNAQKAYNEASLTTAYDLAGNPDRKAFKFKYVTANGKEFNLTIIVGK